MSIFLLARMVMGGFWGNVTQRSRRYFFAFGALASLLFQDRPARPMVGEGLTGRDFFLLRSLLLNGHLPIFLTT